VTDNGVTQSANTRITVTAIPATLVSLVVTPATASIPVGGTVQLSATGTFSDGTTEDLTRSVHWIGSPNASVTQTGLVTGLNVSIALIQAQATVEGVTQNGISTVSVGL
jgi:hypothetical protein